MGWEKGSGIIRTERVIRMENELKDDTVLSSSLLFTLRLLLLITVNGKNVSLSHCRRRQRRGDQDDTAVVYNIIESNNITDSSTHTALRHLVALLPNEKEFSTSSNDTAN